MYLLSLADFLQFFYATRPFYVTCVCASFLQTEQGNSQDVLDIKHAMFWQGQHVHAGLNMLAYLIELSSSAQTHYCIAAQERAEQTGQGCNML